jgi:hypothetical protein
MKKMKTASDKLFSLCLIILVIMLINWWEHQPSLNCHEAPVPKIRKSSTIKLIRNSWWSWHWGMNNDDIKFQQKCPTACHNIEVVVNGAVVASSSMHMLSAFRVLDIFDCLGNIIYKIKSNNWYVLEGSFVLEDGAGNVVANMKTTDYFKLKTAHVITNSVGEVIAVADTNIISKELRIEILQPEDPGADVRALGIAFAHHDFMGKQTDLCNVSILYAGAVIIMGILMLCSRFHSSNRKSGQKVICC